MGMQVTQCSNMTSISVVDRTGLGTDISCLALHNEKTACTMIEFKYIKVFVRGQANCVVNFDEGLEESCVLPTGNRFSYREGMDQARR